jgi:hypothetical protein
MANNTSVYADGAWKDVEHQYVNTADGWNKVSDTYIFSAVAGYTNVSSTISSIDEFITFADTVINTGSVPTATTWLTFDPLPTKTDRDEILYNAGTLIYRGGEVAKIADNSQISVTGTDGRTYQRGSLIDSGTITIRWLDATTSTHTVRIYDYTLSNAGWKKTHEEPYNWRLYGRTAASATAYLNGNPWKNLPQYRFTPRYNQSRLGNAYAGRGMPGDYNAARDGKVIWPYGSSAYANSYVGYYFTPTSDKITIRATCDNGFTVWLNQTQVLNGNSWPTWFQTTRTVVPGDPIYITINCRDWGVLWGACCRVANGTSINGTALLLSDTNWVSR